MRGLWGLLLGMALARPALATQENFQAGSASAPLQSLGTSASAGLFGASYGAFCRGQESLGVNPAGLSATEHFELALHHSAWLLETAQDSLAMALPLGASQSLGLSLGQLDFGSFEARASSGALKGSSHAADYAASLAWACRMGRLNMGLSLSALRQDLDGLVTDEGSAGLGLQWQARPGGFELGWAVDGIGASADGRLPAAMKLALAEPVAMGPDWTLTLAGGASAEALGTHRLDAGLELAGFRRSFLRAAYEYDLSQRGLGGMAGLNLGLGARLGDLSLDYAFLPYGDLGNAQRISLAYALPSEKYTPQPSPVPTPPPTASPTPAPSPPPQSEVAVKFVVRQDPLDQARSPEEDALYAALEKDPGDLKAWHSLADYYRQAGQKDRACQAFEKCLELKPDPELKAWLENYKK